MLAELIEANFAVGTLVRVKYSGEVDEIVKDHGHTADYRYELKEAGDVMEREVDLFRSATCEVTGEPVGVAPFVADRMQIKTTGATTYRLRVAVWKNKHHAAFISIIKCGDIHSAIGALQYIKNKYPHAKIDHEIEEVTSRKHFVTDFNDAEVNRG